MKKMLKVALVASALLGLSSGQLLAAGKKEAFHCVDEAGKEVAPPVKDKKECVAPNKWVKVDQAQKDAAKK